jgi:hypothetical protein
MSSSAIEKTSCSCHQPPQDTPGPVLSRSAKVVKALPSTFMSILIAFFPKCPICWAVYMSMFSSIGLAKIPYMSWLLPVLLAFMGLHLILLARRINQHGYWPFLLSIMGTLVILAGRFWFPGYNWLLYVGVACILSGSLLNSFFTVRTKFLNINN